MATFKRECFNSETNYVKANYLCGHSPVRKVSNLIDSDGNLSFNDETSNFSELIIDKSIDYFANQTGNLELKKCVLTTALNEIQATSVTGGIIDSSIQVYGVIIKAPNLKSIHLQSIKGILWQTIKQDYLLETVIIDDCSQITKNIDYGMKYGIFTACPKLSRLVMNRLTWGGLYLNDTGLTREGLIEFFQSLGNADLSSMSTQTITLGSTKLALLTDEDKKIATDKGWTLA